MKTKINECFKFVHVMWVDSVARVGWIELKELGNNPCVTECHSFGFLVQEGEKAIRIAGHLSNNDTAGIEINGDMVIPRAAIVQMEIIDPCIFTCT